MPNARDALPRPEHFQSREHYYSTLWHEAVHATGASTRLCRKGITDGALFGDHLYYLESSVILSGLFAGAIPRGKSSEKPWAWS